MKYPKFTSNIKIDIFFIIFDFVNRSLFEEFCFLIKTKTWRDDL